MNEITLEIERQQPEITFTIKENEFPTQKKTATPTEQAQVITPDAGFLLEEVDVGAIPSQYIVPEGTKNIVENGDVDVKEYATAHVAVPPPTFQQKTVTPIEQQQVIEADSGFDALERVTVNRIPQEYIVPSGSLDITANADGIDVTDKASVNVAVPVPVMPDEYVIGGSLVDRTAVEYHVTPGIKIIYNNAGLSNQPKLERVYLPDSVETIYTQTFTGCPKLNLQDMPKNLSSIGSYAFFGGVGHTKIIFHSTPTIDSNSFWGCSNLREIYVPWSEGEVANAPWGATNATITYNYTGE